MKGISRYSIKDAPVSQPVEEAVLKTAQCRFESSQEHQDTMMRSGSSGQLSSLIS